MPDRPQFSRRVFRFYAAYALLFIAFVLALAEAERLGLSGQMLGYLFMFVPIGLYAGIGFVCRTADVTEYYVAGRRVPAVFNGMATSADWMSAASFIGLAGTLYVSGFQGLAFVMGWTGGYCLVALLLAPYLRKFGQYTIPDFLGSRYQSNLARFVGLVAAILASFTYVVAQIYGVGLITSRVVGIQFEIGVFVGLAGVLICSFLGGMRAVTWTQVAQYIILIVAYLVPAAMMAQKVTGIPLPQAVYGSVLERLGAKEQALFNDPAEIRVRELYSQRAARIEGRILDLPASLAKQRENLSRRVDALRGADASGHEIYLAEQALHDLPRNAGEASQRWEAERRNDLEKAAAPAAHAEAYPGTGGDAARLNFVALVICLTIGTAALPHILMRYYTTPTVREARYSVFWSLLFILLFYVTAPAYAVLAKWIIYNDLVGSNFHALPAWVASWNKVGLVKVEDINGDGILQLAELSLNPDVLLLATPEIAGLPGVVSGLVAAGGLAAALSTADGLLLTIANALAHDLYFRMIDPRATTQRRLIMSKAMLLLVALIAAWVASLRADTILSMVGLAFSIAAASFFPALVCGVFWKRANRWGAVAGMLVGLGITLYYVARTHSYFGGSMAAAWFDIQPISAGIFGLFGGFVGIVVVSLLTPAPDEAEQDFVENVRYPRLRAK
jgi:cation/acetate symporter